MEVEEKVELEAVVGVGEGEVKQNNANHLARIWNPPGLL